eukprot:9392029-Lingulodinium_polyedra.AAC.1
MGRCRCGHFRPRATFQVCQNRRHRNRGVSRRCGGRGTPRFCARATGARSHDSSEDEGIRGSAPAMN